MFNLCGEGSDAISSPERLGNGAAKGYSAHKSDAPVQPLRNARVSGEVPEIEAFWWVNEACGVSSPLCLG